MAYNNGMPQKTLGILGGGQLGRMSAMAAARLGIKVHIFCPEQNAPASDVAAKTFVADYGNRMALRSFAKSVDAITYEFENIPVETIRYLQKFKPVLPDDRLLEIAQHRLSEKQFLNDIGIPTARWQAAYSPDDISNTMLEWKAKSIIVKTTRFGYDGKGQAKVNKNTDLKKLWAAFKQPELIIEEIVDFACEISVIVARDKLGQTACYVPVLNEHENHILSKTTAPAALPKRTLDKACDITRRLAESVDLVGVLTLEMFVTHNNQLLANEIAPRTHNSGHWTIDACSVSQFEQHVRTVCGLPVGSPERHSNAVMLNLIGDDVKKIKKYWEAEDAAIHLYGKHDVRAGRKMGHITLLQKKK